MGLFSSSRNKDNGVNWINLTDENQLNALIEESSSKAVVFFKHSIRCSISAMAKSRLESNWDLDADVTAVYLDLINYRTISNLLAERFNITHESPQIILVKNGQSIYNASHNQISVDAIKNQL